MRTPIRFRAITPAMWPAGAPRTAESARRASPFKATWQRTLQELDTELWVVGAADVVIEVDCPAVDIRQDGMPKADARVCSPGVVLRFTHCDVGPVIYPCDTFYDWQDNVRAIVLTLNALRAIDRYGAVQRGQQYAGFKALPATAGEVRLTRDQAAAVIAQESGIPADAILGYPEVQAMAINKAVRAAHPDAGGTDDRFALVAKARAALTENAGGAP